MKLTITKYFTINAIKSYEKYRNAEFLIKHYRSVSETVICNTKLWGKVQDTNIQVSLILRNMLYMVTFTYNRFE